MHSELANGCKGSHICTPIIPPSVFGFLHVPCYLFQIPVFVGYQAFCLSQSKIPWVSSTQVGFLVVLGKLSLKQRDFVLTFPPKIGKSLSPQRGCPHLVRHYCRLEISCNYWVVVGSSLSNQGIAHFCQVSCSIHFW